MTRAPEDARKARKSARQRERRLSHRLTIATDPEKIAQEAEEGVWMAKGSRKQQNAAQRREG